MEHSALEIFLCSNGAEDDVIKWARDNCSSIQDFWDTCSPCKLLWLSTQHNILTDAERCGLMQQIALRLEPRLQEMSPEFLQQHRSSIRAFKELDSVGIPDGVAADLFSLADKRACCISMSIREAVDAYRTWRYSSARLAIAYYLYAIRFEHTGALIGDRMTAEEREAVDKAQSAECELLAAWIRANCKFRRGKCEQ